MSYRALIVDDERLARVALRSLLDEHAAVEVIGEADSVTSAAQAVESLRPDILFLDIELPDGIGFDLFEATTISAHVVFVTAFNDHALRAFEVNALDYLVKPVDPSHIERVLARIDERNKSGNGPQRPGSRSLATNATAAADADSARPLTHDDMVCLQSAKSMKFARVSNIVYISAADDYAEVHLSGGAVVLVNQRLRHWEAQLPKLFARTHRSMLVNLHYVDEIELIDGTWTIRLQGQREPLPMSRRYAQALRKRLEVIT